MKNSSVSFQSQSKIYSKEKDYLNSIIFKPNNNISQHHSIPYPCFTKWSGGLYPSGHMVNPSKNVWTTFLNQIMNTGKDDTVTLLLDFTFIDLFKLQSLAKVIEKLDVKISEVALHNIGEIIPCTSEFQLENLINSSLITNPMSYSVMLKSYSQLGSDDLSKSVISSLISSRENNIKSISEDITQDEQESLKSSLSIILKNANKVNVTTLPLISESSSNLVFKILQDVKCNHLQLSSQLSNDNVLGINLYNLMFKNKFISKLDISDFFSSSLQNIEGQIISGCIDNPMLEVKYSTDINKMSMDYANLLGFAQVRIDMRKDGYIKCLIELMSSIRKGLEVFIPGDISQAITLKPLPTDVIKLIITYVEPLEFMEQSPYFKNDKMHILASEEVNITGAFSDEYID